MLGISYLILVCLMLSLAILLLLSLLTIIVHLVQPLMLKIFVLWLELCIILLLQTLTYRSPLANCLNICILLCYIIHFVATKRDFRYIVGTINSSLCFKNVHISFVSMHFLIRLGWVRMLIPDLLLVLFFFGPNPISWGAKKQSTISRSSTEA